MNRLKELREEFGLTVRKLEEYVSISYMTLNNYENENRTINPAALIELSEFYGVTVDYILGIEGSFIYVVYEKTKKKYLIRESLYHCLKKNNLIYYKDYKRYIDLNNFFNIDNVFDVSFLIETMYYSQDFMKPFDGKELSEDEINKIIHPETIEITAYMLNTILEKINDN